MSIKIIGAILLIAGCGSVGFQLAAAHLKEEKTLRQFTAILDYMECELQYHLTPLPELCRQAAIQSKGSLNRVFDLLAMELENQMSPDVARCMNFVVAKAENLPDKTKGLLKSLGRSLGKFDLDGQIKGLESVRAECRRLLSDMEKGKTARLRGYQTLGLCAGAALAILFV